MTSRNRIYLTCQLLTSSVMPAMSVAKEIKQTRPFPSASQEASVALLRTADLLHRLLSAVLEPHDVTVQQYNVLRILRGAGDAGLPTRSEEHTSELQSRLHLVCR